MLRRLIRIIGLVVTIIAIIALRDFVFKPVMTNLLSKKFGTKVEIGKFTSDFFRPGFKIENMLVYNTDEFAGSVMADIPVIDAIFDYKSLKKAEATFPLIEANVREVILVKNKQNELNVDYFKVFEDKSGQKAYKLFLIKTLKLNVAKVTYRDYSVGDQPSIRTVDINIKGQKFHDLKRLNQVAYLLLLAGLNDVSVRQHGLYAAVTELRTGVLPREDEGFLIGDDNAGAEFESTFAKVFQAADEIVRQFGRIISKEENVISGKIRGAVVKIKVQSLKNKRIKVVVTASNSGMQGISISKFVLYQIAERL